MNRIHEKVSLTKSLDEMTCALSGVPVIAHPDGKILYCLPHRAPARIRPGSVEHLVGLWHAEAQAQRARARHHQRSHAANPMVFATRHARSGRTGRSRSGRFWQAGPGTCHWRCGWFSECCIVVVVSWPAKMDGNRVIFKGMMLRPKMQCIVMLHFTVAPRSEVDACLRVCGLFCFAHVRP